jgi:peroxiredoxin
VKYVRDPRGPMKSAIAILVLMLAPLAWGQEKHPILAVGSPAPNFELPGADGKTHQLSDYAASPVLVVAFLCNHCPISQMYEQRVQEMANAYADKGVAVVAIEPNDPKAIRIDELDSSDISDTLEEMKIRVAYKKLTYPYLFDGDTQTVTRAYGPQATPHVFVFDKDRKLRYEGRFDNNFRIEAVKTHEVRDAVDALLAHRDVAVTHMGVFGCSTKWQEKQTASLDTMRKIESQPVKLEMATADDLKKLRQNATGKYVVVNFWATWCGSCIHEMPDLQDTFRMYNVREFDLVTVSANQPDERESVMKMLEKFHATSRNYLFASDDTAAMQKAFDPEWESAVPYTVLIAPDGRILYKSLGSVDILQLRRTVLANLPSDYIGFNKYWSGQ